MRDTKMSNAADNRRLAAETGHWWARNVERGPRRVPVAADGSKAGEEPRSYYYGVYELSCMEW